MALVLSSPLLASGQELPLGSKIPLRDQPLQDATGAQRNLAGVKGEAGTVVVFWSNQCPWVDRYEERVLELAASYETKGFGFALVNSNDPSAFPQESLEESQKRARDRGYTISYFTDEGARLASAFGAERTPQVYVFDRNDNLVYTGSVDDSPSDPAGTQKTHLQDALDNILAGEDVGAPETKAFGCTIKPEGVTG